MPDMTVVQLLEAARELISVPERWTFGDLARNESGRACGVGSTEAKCFCLLGAIVKLCDGRIELFHAACDFVRRAIAPERDIPFYQDHHSHAQVLAACDHAIELARQAEVAHV